MQETRRAILEELDAGPVTGPSLADRLDVSRTAVWNHVEALRDAGFEVPSTEAGYRLVSVPEYGAAAVEYGLAAPFEVEYHASVESTNAVARERAEAGASDLVVLADEQTGGRGRRTRGWESPPGGIWMSVVLRPDRPPATVPLLTLGAAVAVTASVRDRGVPAAITWPNDVIVPGDGERGGKKLCGVLTEMSGEAGRVSWVVVGVGLNANVDPAALPGAATSIEDRIGSVDRRSLVQAILDRFASLRDRDERILERWRDLNATLDGRVRVESGAETITGEAVDVTETGALVVETEAGRRTLHAGDVTHLRRA
ncbi:MAG: biotin--[acetyl-CoA-carboxylase] ligase [Halanaeroarchaeum sp.]